MKKVLLILSFVAFILAMMPANASPPIDDGFKITVLDASDFDYVSAETQTIDQTATVPTFHFRTELSLLLIKDEAELTKVFYSQYIAYLARPPSITVRISEFKTSLQYECLGYSMARMCSPEKNNSNRVRNSYQKLAYSMAK